MARTERDWKTGELKTNGKAETNGEATTPVFADKLLTRSDLRMLPDPEPLIDNVLDQGTTAYLYGSWGTTKTFIALDWAACVATGKPWQGRDTVQRKVLYVVGEGAFGFKGRADAWETGWKTKISDEMMSWYPYPVNLTNKSDVNNLRALIEWGGYDFVILDTLARCMVGADENSAKDCGEVVDAMTRLLASTPGGRGVVLGVHHTGKDGSTFRGSTVFEGAADTVYFTSREDDAPWIDLTRQKRKDGPEHDHHLLKLQPIEGTNSAVVEATTRPPEAPGDGGSAVVSTAQLADIVHRVIYELPDHTVESQRKLLAAMKLAGRLFREGSIRQALDYLVMDGRVKEVSGKRNAISYQAISTAAQDDDLESD
jgi:hypothetical protein